MKQIYILSGAVQTGKTTKLMQWAFHQKNIDGIFQPVVDDKRCIYHIGSRTLKLLEADNVSNENIITIGKYKFLKSTFEWSQSILIDCLNKNLDWIIIDEIGPLELEGNGLEPAISKILIENVNNNVNILCVVRNSILEKYIDHYQLKDKYKLFNL